MQDISMKKFPLSASDYKLYEEIGEGVSANVYRALCIPLNEIVAIKVLDLEKCNNDFDGIRREVQTMSLIDHPNLLRAHCSFTAGSSLWVVMPYMAGGSCLHIMKSGHPDGFEQPVIATLLREVLTALVYLHAHGHIHRDVKAGNILVDSNGDVKLADFGVSACMFDAGDRQRSRNTFVGTPCWMAPEVMQQLHGYDFKADIWSFGITALELAHGHAPFSKYPPMKVLLMTLQNAPPGLDYERDKKFSRSFKDLVAACLVKDPKKRPTSAELLKHKFFKHARSNESLAKSILDGISPLGDRYRVLKAKEAELLLQNKAMYGDKEQLSQQEYIRGISAWNFDLEELKKQAALDYDGISNAECQDLSKKTQKNGLYNVATPAESHFIERLKSSDAVPAQEISVAPKESLEPGLTDKEMRNGGADNLGSSRSIPQNAMSEPVIFSIGSVLRENPPPSRKDDEIGARDQLFIRQTRDTSKLSSVEKDESGYQSRGRFKVQMEELTAKDSMNGLANADIGGSVSSPTITSASILPSIKSILQQNTMQREQIMRLIRIVDQPTEFVEAGNNGQPKIPQGSQPSARERELLSQVTHMQQSAGRLAEELQRQKAKNYQLERQLSALIQK